MFLLRKLGGVWEFLLQQLEFNNNSPEGPYDTVGCNESSANQSLALYPHISNIINNHDDDVYSSDGTKNEDCVDHTEKVTTSFVKRESKCSSLLKPSFVPKSLSLFAFIFDLCDPQSDGRGSERTVISQLHRQTFCIILFCLILFLSMFPVTLATPDISRQMVPHLYPQCEENSTAPDWNHSILYMQSNKLSIKGNHSSMMSVYECQMDLKIICNIIFNCLLLASCILFLLWYIIKLWILPNDNAVQENDLVNSLEHTRPPSSSLGGGGDDGDGETYLSASDFDESEPIHSIITSADSNSHLLVYQKTRKMTQKSHSSLLILTKDVLISERLDDPGENLAVVGKAEYLEESDDDRYLHSQEQECLKSADQLKIVRKKGNKVSYSGDLSSSIILIHQVHENNIVLENTLCVPNPPDLYPPSLKSSLPPPQSPSLMPSLELGCGVFTEAGYALSGCIAGPEEKFGVIELIPSLSDNDNADHADLEPVVGDDDDSVHDNGLYPCCFDVPSIQPFLVLSGP